MLEWRLWQSLILSNWLNSNAFGKDRNRRKEEKVVLEGDRKIINSGSTIFYLK